MDLFSHNRGTWLPHFFNFYAPIRFNEHWIQGDCRKAWKQKNIFAVFLFFYTISFLGNFYFAFFELYVFELDMFWEFFILRELLLTFFYLNCTKLLSYEQTIRKIFRNTPIVVRNNVTWSLRWRVFRTESTPQYIIFLRKTYFVFFETFNSVLHSLNTFMWCKFLSLF